MTDITIKIGAESVEFRVTGTDRHLFTLTMSAHSALRGLIRESSGMRAHVDRARIRAELPAFLWDDFDEAWPEQVIYTQGGNEGVETQ